MILFEEAKARILEVSRPLGKQEVKLGKLQGSYLAEPVAATSDLPAFDSSAVDGYGVHSLDLSAASALQPAKLKLCGVIQAGDSGALKLSPGNTIKILTGAPVPPTVCAVVMKEFCEEQNGSILVKQPAGAGDNIRRRGEEYKYGQEILPRGARITPPVVGLLATLGFSSFPTYVKPRVAVVATGNELARPGRLLAPGQVYDSNSYALVAAARELGIEVCRTFVARDDADATRNAIKQAIRETDVIITAGGVSVGDFDIVRDVLEECGVKEVFWRIAIKPGKPVYFGTVETKAGRKHKLVFGLPGNPVSALVTFHQLVAPALLKIMGASSCCTPVLSAKLTGAVRGRSGRMEFTRGILSFQDGELLVQPAVGQDSHMLGGLSLANCVIYCPADRELLAPGDEVVVQLLSWSF